MSKTIIVGVSTNTEDPALALRVAEAFQRVGFGFALDGVTVTVQITSYDNEGYDEKETNQGFGGPAEGTDSQT